MSGLEGRERVDGGFVGWFDGMTEGDTRPVLAFGESLGRGRGDGTGLLANQLDVVGREELRSGGLLCSMVHSLCKRIQTVRFDHLITSTSISDYSYSKTVLVTSNSTLFFY